MSCNYADGLSPYDNKGVLGVAEKFELTEVVEDKCKTLADWIMRSSHVVVHTGAGISTSAGIPDFRGPNGVWTLEEKGLKPNINISFNEAIPTRTHMALKTLLETGHIKYIISQNIDGLHLRTGVPREQISELHGNMFTEQCKSCKRQFIRNSATTSVGQKPLGPSCLAGKLTGRGCRGKLHDTILDWEDSLPEDDLEMAEYHSRYLYSVFINIDLSICLGTTLQIVPSGKLPLAAKKNGGRLAIINLQPTNLDKKADLLINTYVDDVIEGLMKSLRLEIPEYADSIDPTKMVNSNHVLGWNFGRDGLNSMKQMYIEHNRKFKKAKIEKKTTKVQRNTNSANGITDNDIKKGGHNTISDATKTENCFGKDLRDSSELQNVECPEKQLHEVECSS